MSEYKSAWLSRRAYAIWEAAGRPAGQDNEHWIQAIAEYDLMDRTRASTDGAEVLARRLSSVPTVPMKKGLDHTVLVVEDDIRLRFDTIDALDAAGFATQEAANADEAMIHLRRGPFHSVITDIDMPGSVDGIGLAACIRSLWPKTRIIISSGLVRLRSQDLPTGTAFLAKPAALGELLTLLTSDAS